MIGHGGNHEYETLAMVVVGPEMSNMCALWILECGCKTAPTVFGGKTIPRHYGTASLNNLRFVDE